MIQNIIQNWYRRKILFDRFLMFFATNMLLYNMQQLSQHFLYQCHFLHPVKFQQQIKKNSSIILCQKRNIPQFAFLWRLHRQFNPNQLKMYNLFKISEFISDFYYIIFYSPVSKFSVSICSTWKFICSSNDGVRR